MASGFGAALAQKGAAQFLDVLSAPYRLPSAVAFFAGAIVADGAARL